ncbi:MAG TPA: TIM barrel protein, partial [Terriglobales bacterium]|nr:TIM barrel protein [Terriglobales bacterium]
MKVGIDSYCYHRFFGEVYPQQRQPDRSMTVEDFIRRAQELGVDGVSLESCFLPSRDSGYLQDLGQLLDSRGMELVYAWGHPDGLEGGANIQAYEEMIGSFKSAHAIGAKVMRVVGSSLRFRDQPHSPQLERLAGMFRDAVRIAADYGIRMAVENHIDFTSSEMVQLLDAVDSVYLG